MNRERLRNMYVKVAVNLPLDKLFFYSVPDGLREKIAVGKRILVSFRNKNLLGYIVGITERCNIYPVKPIIRIIDDAPSLDEEMLKLAKWLSEYYCAPLGEVIKAALPLGVRKIYKRAPKRILPSVEPIEMSTPFLLNAQQKEAFRIIHNSILSGSPETILIRGITASGKTELYMQAISEMLAKNKQAIVLVPEISLTPQAQERFAGRFGKRAILLHSRLTGAERAGAWREIYDGKIDIVIGARSAVFAPLKNLGLIVIDEEHENSYKQNESPRYHARDVALKRAQSCGALVIMGSATPSLESFYAARREEHKLIHLTKRIDDKPLPEVEIVDMRREFSGKGYFLFSRRLRDALEEVLKKRKQAIVLLNRRGYSTFLMCKGCGYVARCKHCSVSLTYHSGREVLRCHYCDYEEPLPSICPECNKNYIRRLGMGTQQVEKRIKEHFPLARIQRMDSDVTRKRHSYVDILKRFEQREIDILVGTQMIAKGLDFPEVTLVGVISADTALNLPDLRASERTFQLLTQVAGRAGRGDDPGKVIVQTYNPRHYAIQYAKLHDYIGFYNKEIDFRRQLLYPPFTHFIAVIVRGKDKKKAGEASVKLGAFLEEKRPDTIKILGPIPAPLPKIRGKFRFQLILKGSKPDELRALLRENLARIRREKGLEFVIDVDPINML